MAWLPTSFIIGVWRLKEGLLHNIFLNTVGRAYTGVIPQLHLRDSRIGGDLPGNSMHAQVKVVAMEAILVARTAVPFSELWLVMAQHNSLVQDSESNKITAFLEYMTGIVMKRSPLLPIVIHTST